MYYGWDTIYERKSVEIDSSVAQRVTNHVLKIEGPIHWSRVLLPFYRKKLDRSTQFGAVGYIITLYSSKS